VDDTENFTDDDQVFSRNLVLRRLNQSLVKKWATHICHEFTNEPFRLAIRVEVGRVDRRHSAVPSGFQQGKRLIFVQDPGLLHTSYELQAYSRYQDLPATLNYRLTFPQATT
jgi:hypothetical protein